MKRNSWYSIYNILIFDRIDSTNEEAKRLISANIDENFLIWTKSQTNGRGRYGRNWSSPEGNLYFSLVLKPNSDVKKVAQLSFVAAVSLGDALREYKKLAKIEYKWPNDIIVNDKKCGGIILESLSNFNSNHINWLIIGVGVNIKSFPINNMIYEATSLQKENIDISVERLLDKFMQNFTINYNKWENNNFTSIRKKWLKQAMNLNKVLTVTVGKNRISGIFSNITNQGDLEITLASGEICYISTGEIYKQ